jgi:hypothetical protein
VRRRRRTAPVHIRETRITRVSHFTIDTQVIRRIGAGLLASVACGHILPLTIVAARTCEERQHQN